MFVGKIKIIVFLLGLFPSAEGAGINVLPKGDMSCSLMCHAAVKLEKTCPPAALQRNAAKRVCREDLDSRELARQHVCFKDIFQKGHAPFLGRGKKMKKM